MMRAVRFATRLQFTIHPGTLEAIKRNAQRLKIIVQDRITTELQKIMASQRPSIGWMLLRDTGLLPLILPELQAMCGVEVMHGRGHNANFLHTMKDLDNVAAATADVWPSCGRVDTLGRTATRHRQARHQARGRHPGLDLPES